MNISADMVKTLRERTGVGMMECKKALVEAEGDLDKAQENLRKKGLAAAASRGDRATAEGAISTYVHLGGQIGVMLELNCETDFVARNEQFQALSKDLCMHIAAAAPRFVTKDEVPAEEVEKEKEILMAQPDMANKPDNVKAKIIEGRIEKHYENVCLLHQPFVKDPAVKIEELINQTIATIGEKIVVKRFARFVVGEA
jgi:elongation factor Ts